MSISDFIIKHSYWIILANVMFFILLIGIYNAKMTLPYAFFGLAVLCVVDRYQEKLLREA